MDDLHRKTLNVGFIIAFAIFAVGFAIPFVIDGLTGQWVSIGFNVVALAFLGIWVLAAKRGFRVGQTNRGERRAKERQREERDKRMRLRR